MDIYINIQITHKFVDLHIRKKVSKRNFQPLQFNIIKAIGITYNKLTIVFDLFISMINIGCN